MASPADMMAALAKLDPDLLFQWNEFEIPLEVQYTIAMANYKNVRQFVGIEDTRALVRAAVQRDFLLDPNVVGPAGILNRRAIAALVGAWEVLKEQNTKESQIRAESRVMNTQRPLGHNERSIMRRLIEGAYGKLPNSELPSSEYLAAKAEQVELDDPHASSLDEVTSLADAESLTLSASLSLTGAVQIVHKKGKIAFPTGPEQFRMRMRVEAHTWVMLAGKYPNRAWLVGIDRDTFNRYTDYFLGEKVMLLKIPLGDTTVTLDPQWKIVLNYELQCRRAAFDLVRDSEPGCTLKDALMISIKDSELKEVHFTSPIALGNSSSHKRSLPAIGASSNPQPGKRAKRTAARLMSLSTAAPKGSKGNGKGSKGAKGGKGKGKRKYQSNTADGRQLCFNFNSEVGCDGSCGRVHLCSITGCQEEHSAVNCPKL